MLRMITYLMVFLAAVTVPAFCKRTNKGTTLRDVKLRKQQQLIYWLRAKGGFFSPKISFEPLDKKDEDLESGGIFAHQAIQKGERLMFIPRHCLFQPTDNTDDGTTSRICRTAKLLVEEYQAGNRESSFWPYVEYVFDFFPHDHLPAAWSPNGKALVQNIVGVNLLDPEDFGDFRKCSGLYKSGKDYDKNYNRLLDAARRIVDARGWNEVLVPVFDMGNHRNGHWHNMDQLHDSRTHDDFEVVARRDIEPGEQLFLSYNECPDYTCAGAAHSYLTPQLFKDYGFVEQYPQRWAFYTRTNDGGTSKLLFDLDVVDDESMNPKNTNTQQRLLRLEPQQSPKLKVSWLSSQKSSDEPAPRDTQIQWLEAQLKRLQGMEDYVASEAHLLPPHEQQGAVSYYKAMMQAMESAILKFYDKRAPLNQEKSQKLSAVPRGIDFFHNKRRKAFAVASGGQTLALQGIQPELQSSIFFGSSPSSGDENMVTKLSFYNVGVSAVFSLLLLAKFRVNKKRNQNIQKSS
ncbi:hypothetical protein ACA910_000377 [Epithemia clementina (nom. ined.)]